MKNLNSAFVAIPLLFSLLALSRLQHNNKFFIGSFVNKNHACEKNTTPIKPGVVLRCESNDGKVFEYAIREEKITMIADVAGYGTAEPIQFNVALPNSKVVNLSDNRPAVVYISVLGNYEFASDVEWDYLSSYTQDGQGDETAIRKCITINQFPFSAKVRKITIAKVGDKSGVVTINFKVQFKKSN